MNGFLNTNKLLYANRGGIQDVVKKDTAGFLLYLFSRTLGHKNRLRRSVHLELAHDILKGSDAVLALFDKTARLTRMRYHVGRSLGDIRNSDG